MATEVVRKLIGGVWRTVTSRENGGGGGSQPPPGPWTIYANKWQTIAPTQNLPGYAVADGGTFKLSYDGAETAALAFSATAADVLAALNALAALAGKISLDTDDHTGGGALAGPLPTAGISFVLDDSLAPQFPIVLSDNSLTNGGDPIDPWPVGVTPGYILTSQGFTPAAGDVIDDFSAHIIVASDGGTGGGPQEVYLTDGTLANIINDNPPTFWLTPGFGVVDLNRTAPEFANFSGQSASSLDPLIASARDAELSATPPGTSLPALCLNSVPLRWYFRVDTGAPIPNGVYRLVVKTTPTSA